MQHMLGEPDWKSMNSPNLCEFDQNSTKPFEVLSGILQALELARSGILENLLLSFFEILKCLVTQFSVVHRGCVDIFWNSPICIPMLYWVSQLNLQVFKGKEMQETIQAVPSPFTILPLLNESFNLSTFPFFLWNYMPNVMVSACITLRIDSSVCHWIN